jgi:cytochrome c-type biogenesis protein
VDPAAWVQAVASRPDSPYLAAFAVGLLAAIGPCPLATNITALGYIAQQFADRRAVVASGALYAFGRALAYGLVGALVMLAGAQVSRLATGLQDAADLLLGPFLIFVGLVLLDVIHLRLPGGGNHLHRLRERVAKSRRGGAFGLGFLFALAFCPYSATLFFLFLIPMALRSGGGLGMPFVFGIGTAMPVLILGIPLALGIERAAAGVNKVGRVEVVVRKVTAWLFIGAGLFSLARSVEQLLPQP